MYRRHAKSIAAIASLLAATGAMAFQPLTTDDTGTQGAGGNQVEAAGTRTKDDATTTRELALVYTRGLTDTLDAFVELGRQRIEASGATANGPTSPTLGVKWRFYENERKTSLALKPQFHAAVSADDEAKGMGPGKASYDLALIFTQEMAWGAVHANLSAGRERFRAPAADTTGRAFSVAPVWNVDEHWKLAVDLGVSRSTTQGVSEQSRFGELGAIYSPNADLDFALGFIREKNRDSGEVAKTATAGLTWRFK